MNRWAVGLAFLLVSGAAAAQATGGFRGPDGVTAVSAAEAAEFSDDTQVKVTGYVARSLGDENYEFQDDSGTLIVEIDDDEWGGIEADPNTRLELIGEIEKDSDDAELDVEHVRVAPEVRG